MGKPLRIVGFVSLATFGMSVAHGAVSIGVNFTGVTLDDTFILGTEATPPDTMGAVGPSHVAEFINGAYAVYNKSTGALIGSKITDKAFWSNAGISAATLAPGISDPRINYDPISGRWFATQINVSSTNNTVLVARSETSDPTGTWKATSFNGGNTRFLDYDTLAVTNDAVLVGGIMFTNGTSTGTFSGTSLFAIPKTSLTASTPTTANMTQFNNQSSVTYGFGFQPGNGAPAGHVSALSISDAATTQVKVTRINNPASGAATLDSPVTLGTAYGNPLQIHQPDGTQQISPVDSRISAAVTQVGNYLYGVRAVNNGGYAALHVFKIDETTNTMVSEQLLADPTGHYDYFQPSIAVSSTGAVLIGFNRAGDATTGAAGALSSYAFAGIDGTGSITFDATPTLLHQGVSTAYHLLGGSDERWGDYSATWVDPSNPDSFWTFQEFPSADNRWATQITQVIFLPVPEPTALLGVGVALAAMSLRPRRRASVPTP